MENLFNGIQTHIATNMPKLSLVDENYGQLQTKEDTYPVTFPCVLIDTPQTEWENLSAGAQRGKCRLTVQLAIDCYEDTHYGSGTEGKIAQRQKMANKLHSLLHLLRMQNVCGPMIRKTSRGYSLPGGIKVYEIVYEMMVFETTVPK